MWKPDTVVIGPAGAKAFLFTGAIKTLEREDFLNNVELWIGVSAGAALSLLLVCGFKIKDIIEICMDLSLKEDLTNINLTDIQNKFGFISGKILEEKLKQCVIEKFGKSVTMQELKDLTEKTWIAVAFNMDKLEPEYFSYENFPNLSVVEAAMMSMSIPILFQPRKYNGYVYVDGAIGAPYPILKFDNGKRQILGLFIYDEMQIYSDNITEYLYRLIHAGMKILRDLQINYSSENVKHIRLKSDIKDSTGVSISKQNREIMIQYGEKCAETFMKINKEPQKYCYEIGENEEIPFN